MLESAVLGVFCAELMVCVFTGVPIVAALVAGLALFIGYGLWRGCRLRELACMCARGVASARGVLESFVLIGALSAGQIASVCVLGFTPADPTVAELMSGGGVVSMVNVSLVVCLSSSFSGLFDGTGLLDGVHGLVEGLVRRVSPYAAVLAVSVPASMVACNQTLGIMLTSQLCGHAEAGAPAPPKPPRTVPGRMPRVLPGKYPSFLIIDKTAGRELERPPKASLGHFYRSTLTIC